MTYDRPTTPMMKQYFEIKDSCSDCILFYRLGDFYEMFFDDAVIASKELELTLTGRDCGMDNKAPMCGVPFHAADAYINKLVSRGYRIAICEQVEDPSSAKGLVKRDVIRIISAGTNTNMNNLEADKPNYLMSLYYDNNCFGIACADILTGDFFVDEVDSTEGLYELISAYAPSEIIYDDSMALTGFCKNAELEGISILQLSEEYFNYSAARKALMRQSGQVATDAADPAGLSSGAVAAGAILLYLEHMQRQGGLKLKPLRMIKADKYMVLDDFSRKNLELSSSLSDRSKKGSLLWVIDKTMTAMGARRLRDFLAFPLYDIREIRKRQELISELISNRVILSSIRQELSKVYDLDRLMGRILCKSANPRDLISFRGSIAVLPELISHISELPKDSRLAELLREIDDLSDICRLLQLAIDDEAGIALKDGDIIKSGYDTQVDSLREAAINGSKWLSELEAAEREATGIKTLKIKYNRIFGYCIEITNSYKDSIPDRYIRRQTMANAERYTTDELNRTGELILGSRDKLLSLEYQLFVELRDSLAEVEGRLRRTTEALSLLDAYASLAYVAISNRYVKPDINDEGLLDIRQGRHPVVEQMLKSNSFIANNTFLDMKDDTIAVITGPNMAGKSTYMRQVALIVLLAHIGSYVPASEANIPLTDRIFTRVGASDDLASGKSTFMVEMTEVAHILKNATQNSLLILDEIGRGTGTIDGLSIAWAVVEYVAKKDSIGAKTLFATHYHELSELEGRLQGVRNYNIAVKEQGDDIVFLRRILKGGVDKSYGIQVARLAGVPEAVINRASELLLQLKNNDLMEKIRFIDVENTDSQEQCRSEHKSSECNERNSTQLGLFDEQNEKYAEIIEELREMPIEEITPLEALKILDFLRSRCR